ncbi:uncharacterized protein LOC142236450 [Haematobia irritans]|uniref:uncharacterized protein LOC142236450 n=1 Tax=Haematobia irritans TaxID=7368 RepID=UPI003F4F75C6
MEKFEECKVKKLDNSFHSIEMEMTSKNEPPVRNNSSKVIIKFKPDGLPLDVMKTLKTQPAADATEKGPNVIVRSVDLNEGIEITRRFGEGVRPIFDRADVKANAIANDESDNDNVKKETPKKSDKVDDRYGKSNIYNKNDPQHRLRVEDTNVRNEPYRSEYKKKGIEQLSRSEGKSKDKAPYFSDPIRERDRLRRLYGSAARPKSITRSSPNYETSRSSHPRRRSISRPRQRSRSRDRSRSRKRTRSRYRSRSTHRSRSKERSAFANRSRSSRRSCSMYRSRSCSPHRIDSFHKSYSPQYRSGRNHTEKRQHTSRSPNIDRRIHESRGHSKSPRNIREKNNARHGNRIHESNPPMPPPFMPMPVGVPDYSYPYSGTSPYWPHQIPPHRHPPPYYRPFPIVSMIPAVRHVHHPACYQGLAPAMPLIPVPAFHPVPILRMPPPPKHRGAKPHFRNKKT